MGFVVRLIHVIRSQTWPTGEFTEVDDRHSLADYKDYYVHASRPGSDQRSGWSGLELRSQPCTGNTHVTEA